MNDREIVQAFLEESREDLDQLDRDLVELEARPSDPDLLARVFRTIHTIKGTCGFLGFERLEDLTHCGENLLAALRTGDLVLDGGVTTSLLGLIDAIRAVLAHVEATGEEGDEDHVTVVTDLQRHLTGEVTVPPAPPPQEPSQAEPQTHDRSAVGNETSVRVDVRVLDKLLDLVAELGLARSQIGEIAGAHDDGPLAAPYRQLRLLTAELQDGVMHARLQPIGTVIGKFRRIARDLGTALDKLVLVELEGEEVGVDKAVNEALRDPLLHLVRNAVDHGIEAPAERIAAGKPREGRLRIRASHESGRVQVEVSDDGAGIDGERLAGQAVTAGLLTAEAAAELTHEERLELMFLPGLSTKNDITNVSGRGVGMDAVRADLEEVGGTFEATSAAGHGTCFRITVPLTLAIMPAVIVWSGGQRFAVPQVDVAEVVHVAPADVHATIDEVNGTRLYRLRGQLLPLLELSAQLGLVPQEPVASLAIVVVEHAGRRFGLVVDWVDDTTEAMVKPLPRAIRSIAGFAGVTILGDGQPSLILDVVALGIRAGIEVPEEAAEDVQEPAFASPVDSLLLATGPNGSQLAFPLRVVHRLERFERSSVEGTAGSEVVQYEGRILPLVWLADGGADGPAVTVQTVVCRSSGGLVGMVVDSIEDVVAEPAAPAQRNPRDGARCLVVEGRLTDVVEVDALMAAAGLVACQ